MIAFHNKRLRFVLLFLVLAVLCFGSVADHLYKNSTNTITVDNQDSLPLSVNGHQITQELRLEGELKQILLFCSAPSGAAYQDAAVTFTVEQEDNRYVLTAPAKEFTSPYSFKLPMLKFHTGDATLTISGENFPEETDLFFFTSQTETTGLNAAQMDDNRLPGPLLMHYTVVRHDGYFLYDTIMIVLLVAAIFGISWFVSFHKEKAVETKWLFFCSCILLFIYISLKNPLATFLAEPHSEMAYEFWYKARNLSFFENLMSLMSGESLVWTERLMMWAAVQLAGNGKYVFVIAQLMQAMLICGVSSMICLPTFRRWFPAEIRLLISWFLGGAMMFSSAYYFWAVSYWTSFFIIPFAFVDMEKLPRWKYLLAMAFTIVLCVSRIYHILYIPIALLALFALGKERGKRFSWYCIIVAVSSAFEVVYSMVMGGSGHIDLTLLNPLLSIENTIYYQIQVMISLFMGNANVQAPLVNVAFLIIFISIFVAACWLLIIQWKNLQKRTYGTILMALGILSLGSIFINVVVCECSSSVGFPYDYASSVNWGETFYQNADLHFSYSYFAVVSIILVVIHALNCRWKELQRNICPQPLFGYCAAVMVFVCVMLFASVNPQSILAIRQVPTDWKSVYWVTQKESYYLPINVSYQFANISLYHNSESIICGMTDNGEEAVWTPTHQAYSADQKYHTIAPGKVTSLASNKMLSLSAQKAKVNFADPMVLVLYDQAGGEIAHILQANAPDRTCVNFMLDEPISGVYSVSFQLEDGSPAFVCDSLQIGIVCQKVAEESHAAQS